MKTALTSEIVVASPIDDATASRRILHRAGLVAGVSLLCAGLVACVESGSTPTTTAPQAAAAPPLLRRSCRSIRRWPTRRILCSPRHRPDPIAW